MIIYVFLDMGASPGLCINRCTQQFIYLSIVTKKYLLHEKRLLLLKQKTTNER
jgi:hypothetical protein